MLQIDDWVELTSEIEDENVNVGSLLQVVDITLDKKRRGFVLITEFYLFLSINFERCELDGNSG